MKINIINKNPEVSEDMDSVIEKKFDKLSKYFSDDIESKVMISAERGRTRLEATINARGMIFRAEETAQDALDCVDRVVEKLSTQMSRFKTKLQHKHKDNKSVIMELVPEPDDESEIKVVKTKKFQLEPMTADEAILRMEMLEHNFFVFMDVSTDTVNVVYKRNDGDYGLLETVY